MDIRQPAGTAKEDDFEARQRVRLAVGRQASSLSGTVYFEIGDTIWGKNSTGGAIGADQRIIELKNAYIDWMIPETEVKGSHGYPEHHNPRLRFRQLRAER